MTYTAWVITWIIVLWAALTTAILLLWARWHPVDLPRVEPYPAFTLVRPVIDWQREWPEFGRARLRVVKGHAS